jgi:prepilin-type N-terminal cleavage/methylation domain-containing protein/prepilin-type processing-associated H-X9-DG protein
LSVTAPSTTPPAEHRAFTVVELLVVMGILAVLTGLLLPSLSRGRGLAQATACLGNLRQVGIALQVYVPDNDDRMPLMRDRPLDSATTNESLPALPGLPGPELVLSNVLGHPTVLRCPADRQGIYERTGSSYSWNSLLNGQPASRLRILSLELEAHQVPVFFDKEGFHRSRGERRAVNYLYADGHLRNLLVLEGTR